MNRSKIVVCMGLLMGLLGLENGMAQDLILKQGEVVVNNDSIYLSGTKETQLIEVMLSVTNARTTAVTLKLKKTELFIVEGCESSFCWGECYAPFVMTSQMSITIQPGATDRTSFVGDYRPFGLEGTSIVRYTFFNPTDTSYQQSVTVFFQIGASGIANVPYTDPIRVYPNPADQVIRVAFPDQRPGYQELSLVNLHGQVLLRRTAPVLDGAISLSTAEIPAGVYFLKLEGFSGKQQVAKVFISH
jgi:hypothetical protein